MYNSVLWRKPVDRSEVKTSPLTITWMPNVASQSARRLTSSVEHRLQFAM